MWQVCQPSHTYFGEGEIQNIGKYMEEAGLDQALLISTPSMVRHGIADKIVEYSNGRIVGISTHVQPDATVDDANANAEEARKVNAKCLIALGGGSAIDCTKVTAVAYSDNVPAETFLGFEYVPKSAVPIIAIPTTSGSGSELTGDAGMHDPKTGGLGGFLANPHTFPSIAIVDPELTYTVPASVTAKSPRQVPSGDTQMVEAIRRRPVPASAVPSSLASAAPTPAAPTSALPSPSSPCTASPVPADTTSKRVKCSGSDPP